MQVLGGEMKNGGQDLAVKVRGRPVPKMRSK